MSKENSADDKQKHPDEKIFWFVAIGFIAMVVAPAAYIIAFFDYEAGGPGEWGDFATYFSGIVTPVVALCSAVLFFRSIIVQREELAETRKEMQKATVIHEKEQQHRFNLQEQEQLQRTLVILSDMRITEYKALLKYVKSTGGLPKQDGNLSGIVALTTEARISALAGGNRVKVEQILQRYYEKAIHSAIVIKNFIRCDGDVYLKLTDLEELQNELKVTEKFIRALDLEEQAERTSYLKELNELKDIVTFKIAMYGREVVTKPQSA